MINNGNSKGNGNGNGNGNGGPECVAITPPTITPAIEWDDEVLESGVASASSGGDCPELTFTSTVPVEWDDEPTEQLGT